MFGCLDASFLAFYDRLINSHIMDLYRVQGICYARFPGAVICYFPNAAVTLLGNNFTGFFAQA